MRPRHKAAENVPSRLQGFSLPAPSMRPRHKAAENIARGATPDDDQGRPSMRPRHKAAENAVAIGKKAFPLSRLQ